MAKQVVSFRIVEKPTEADAKSRRDALIEAVNALSEAGVWDETTSLLTFRSGLAASQVLQKIKAAAKPIKGDIVVVLDLDNSKRAAHGVEDDDLFPTAKSKAADLSEMMEEAFGVSGRPKSTGVGIKPKR